MELKNFGMSKRLEIMTDAQVIEVLDHMIFNRELYGKEVIALEIAIKRLRGDKKKESKGDNNEQG